MPRACSASITPIWASPRAPPAPSTSATFSPLRIFGGSAGDISARSWKWRATAANAPVRATPAVRRFPHRCRNAARPSAIRAHCCTAPSVRSGHRRRKRPCCCECQRSSATQRAAFGAEHDRRPVLRRAGEDAVARGQVFVELVVARCRARRHRAASPRRCGRPRNCAAPSRSCVPRIQVPVVAIVRDALRRDGAPRLLVGRTRAVVERQLAAAPSTAEATDAERMLVQAARAAGDHAHALDRPALAAGLFAPAAFRSRCCSGASAVDSTPPPLRESNCCAASSACSSSEFSHRPGQLEAIALAGVVAEAGLAVADHRRHQAVAEERKVAIDGGARAAQFLLQPRAPSPDSARP